MRDLIVRAAAEGDIADAALWYESRSTGLGSEFLRAVDACLAEVRHAPRRLPVVHMTVGRALLRRFPYALFFVEREDAVVVIACMHVRREPRRWQQRAGE